MNAAHIVINFSGSERRSSICSFTQFEVKTPFEQIVLLEKTSRKTILVFESQEKDSLQKQLKFWNSKTKPGTQQYSYGQLCSYKHNRLTSGELLSNDWRVFGFKSSCNLRMLAFAELNCVCGEPGVE